MSAFIAVGSDQPTPAKQRGDKSPTSYEQLSINPAEKPSGCAGEREQRVCLANHSARKGEKCLLSLTEGKGQLRKQNQLKRRPQETTEELAEGHPRGKDQEDGIIKRADRGQPGCVLINNIATLMLTTVVSI